MALNTNVTARGACSIAIGEVLGKPERRHTIAQVVALLTELVLAEPRGIKTHAICDNMSGQKPT